MLRNGLPEGDAGEDRSLRLLAVDIRDVGHGVRRAVLPGGGDAVIAHVDVGAVGVLHVEGHAVHVPLLLDHGHGQVGHGGGHGEDFADLQLVDVIAGVQGQQLLGGEVVVLGNLGPGVSLGHGVGDLGGLGAVEGFRQEAQVHQAVRGHELLLHLHVLGEGDGDGALVGGGELNLLQELFQSALIGRRADALPVHIQAVGGGDHAHLLAQGLLIGFLVHQILAAKQAGGILNQGIINGEAPSQSPGGDPLQLLPGLLGLRLVGEGGQDLAVVGDGGAHGVGGEEQQYRRQNAAAGQERHGVNTPAPLSLGTLGALLTGGAVFLQYPFLKQVSPHGEHTPEEQHHLHRQTLGLREAMGLVLPDDAPPAAAEVQLLLGDGLAQTAGLPLGAPGLPGRVLPVPGGASLGSGAPPSWGGLILPVLRGPVPDGGGQGLLPVPPGAPPVGKVVLHEGGGLRLRGALLPVLFAGLFLGRGGGCRCFFLVFTHRSPRIRPEKAGRLGPQTPCPAGAGSEKLQFVTIAYHTSFFPRRQVPERAKKRGLQRYFPWFRQKASRKACSVSHISNGNW